MLKSRRWRVLLVLSLTLAVTVIAVASLYPRLQIRWPGGGEGFDLGFHGAAYGVLVIICGMLQYRLRKVGVAVFLYSILLEGLQYIVPGREVHLSDLAANTIGILAGLAIVALWRRQQAVPEPDGQV